MCLSVACAGLALGSLGCRHSPARVTALPPAARGPADTAAFSQTSQTAAQSTPLPAPEAVATRFAAPLTNLIYEGWVPITTWAKDVGIGPPTTTVAGPDLLTTLQFPTGVLTLRSGRQRARWDGADFWLAFPSRNIRGQACIHALDIQKTLWPILTDNADLPVANRVVVLDAGHGGRDPGARNVATGHWEKEYTLDWALRLRPLLEQQGWQVVLTRTNDTDVTLAERVAIADAQRAGLFLSLHFNFGGANPGESGIETYCVTPAGLPSSVVRPPPEDPNELLPNNAFDEPNLRLAIRVQRALIRRMGAIDRGVRRARFMGVLRGQERVALLIEGGYLSNPGEARLVSSPEHRHALALAVAEALTPTPRDIGLPVPTS